MENTRPLFHRLGRAAAWLAPAALAVVVASQTLERANAATVEAPRRLPSPVLQGASALDPAPQVVVLSGGCFWGVQGVFQHVKGVISAVSGYAGGAKRTAEYETVSTGLTGHAESVRIVFDPRQISFGEILRIFFSVATDPTQVNGQFPDEGSQYRSEIFFANAGQRARALAYIAQLDHARAFSHRIATRVDPLTAFYPAESYHQNYLQLHEDSPYIATYDLPKLSALRSLFPADYSVRPVLVR